MSPDEALSAGDRIKLWAWATLSQTPEAKLVLKLDGRLTMAEALLAHRASGEGGPTSALRASAPEGEDTFAAADRAKAAFKQREAGIVAMRADRDRLRTALRGLLTGISIHNERLVGKIARPIVGPVVTAAQDALAASVEAGPSRGADAPLAPEEIAKLRIFCEDKRRPLRKALALMTDKWCDGGRYASQTVLDMRDALLALLAIVDALPPQADAQANLARAAHSLAPSGATMGEDLLEAISGLAAEHDIINPSDTNGIINWVSLILRARRETIAERDAAIARADVLRRDNEAHVARCYAAEARAEAAEKHLASARAMLRVECADVGCNDWPDDLHLADVVEKHLCRTLSAKLAAAEAQAGRMRHEIDVLRQYGNKDCTAMADAVLRAPAPGGSSGEAGA